MKFPKGWTLYNPVGTPIGNTRILGCKTPISKAYNMESDFTPAQFLETVGKGRVGLVVDLTKAWGYYQPEEVTVHGAKYVKLALEGRGFIPKDHEIARFQSEVSDFLSSSADPGTLACIHCTHGVNRTGFMICRYLIDVLGYEPSAALQAFSEARPPGIQRPNYTEAILYGNSTVPPTFQPYPPATATPTTGTYIHPPPYGFAAATTNTHTHTPSAAKTMSKQNHSSFDLFANATSTDTHTPLDIITTSTHTHTPSIVTTTSTHTPAPSVSASTGTHPPTRQWLSSIIASTHTHIPTGTATTSTHTPTRPCLAGTTASSHTHTPSERIDKTQHSAQKGVEEKEGGHGVRRTIADRVKQGHGNEQSRWEGGHQPSYKTQTEHNDKYKAEPKHTDLLSDRGVTVTSQPPHGYQPDRSGQGAATHPATHTATENEMNTERINADVSHSEEEGWEGEEGSAYNEEFFQRMTHEHRMASENGTTPFVPDENELLSTNENTPPVELASTNENTPPLEHNRHQFAPTNKNTSPMDQNKHQFAPTNKNMPPLDQNKHQFAPTNKNTTPLDQYTHQFAPTNKNTTPLDQNKHQLAPTNKNTPPLNQKSSEHTPGLTSDERGPGLTSTRNPNTKRRDPQRSQMSLTGTSKLFDILNASGARGETTTKPQTTTTSNYDDDKVRNFLVKNVKKESRPKSFALGLCTTITR